MSRANRDGDRSDQFDLQSVHADLQEVRGMVLAVPRHPRWRWSTKAAYYAQADRACVAMWLPDRQGWLQDQGDPRGDRCLDPGRLRDAAKFDGTRGNHIRNQRGHHAVHISHLLCYARGTYIVRTVGGTDEARS